MNNNQILNLIELFVVWHNGAENNSLTSRGVYMDSPDYVLEKFHKYLGTELIPLPPRWLTKKYNIFHDGVVKSYTLKQLYTRYRDFWETEDTALLQSVFCLYATVCHANELGIKRTKTSGVDGVFEILHRHFTGTTTSQRYSHINVKLKTEIFDKFVAMPSIARTIKIKSISK